MRRSAPTDAAHGESADALTRRSSSDSRWLQVATVAADPADGRSPRLTTVAESGSVTPAPDDKCSLSITLGPRYLHTAFHWFDNFEEVLSDVSETFETSC